MPTLSRRLELLPLPNAVGKGAEDRGVAWRGLVGGGALLLATGCQGSQSALDPAGTAAEEIAVLFWVMAGGATIIWLVVIGLFAYAIWVEPRPHEPRRSRLWIIGGGAIVPTLILTVLLAFGLEMLPRLLAPPPQGSRQIEVAGAQWWWRVRYLQDDGDPIELANEIRLPVGQPVQLLLESEDVIHAFWVPSLGGKIDMIPGRQTRLTLHPTRTGVFRGQCAEYCGASHTWMAFHVIVMPEQEFGQWLAAQQHPAETPRGEEAERGAAIFRARGCGACHTVRGTDARGVVGPDLTHVGSRHQLGAGTLGTELEDFEQWLQGPEHFKPEVRMPAFDMLSPEELRALAIYLQGLQ